MQNMAFLEEAGKRLDEATEPILKMMDISGIPSLSYAVIHHGCIIRVQHLGYRDVEAQIKSDNDTRYNINSMTKALLASLVSMEVSRGTLELSTLVKDLLPDFKSSSPIVTDHSTIIDLLSHTMGIGDRLQSWYGSHNTHLLDRAQALPSFATTKPIAPFRSSFTYNNWGYDFAGQILEKINGKKLSEIFHERIFGPLNMTRTSTSWNDTDDDNITKSYTILDDQSVFEVERQQLESGQIMEAAGGVKSSINDLIKLYGEMLRGISNSFGDNDTKQPTSIFDDCADIFSTHNPLPGLSLREQSYGAGWFRAQLPASLGRFSGNGKQPIVGRGVESQLVIYHLGGISGSTTAVYLLPETQSAVIALQNSKGPMDIADYGSELLIERLLNVPNPVDFVELAREVVARELNSMNEVKTKLDHEKILGTRPKPLSAYMGRYWNDIHTWCIDVSVVDDHLVMSLQGRLSETFSLEHYHHDTFSWWMPWNDIMKAARYTQPAPSFWLIDFESDHGGLINKLCWAWDSGNPNDKQPFIRDKIYWEFK